MKLEAVDRRFPYFVCVATIMDRKGVHYQSIPEQDNTIFYYYYFFFTKHLLLIESFVMHTFLSTNFYYLFQRVKF